MGMFADEVVMIAPGCRYGLTQLSESVKSGSEVEVEARE